jgi:hypothetical protein
MGPFGTHSRVRNSKSQAAHSKSQAPNSKFQIKQTEIPKEENADRASGYSPESSAVSAMHHAHRLGLPFDSLHSLRTGWDVPPWRCRHAPENHKLERATHWPCIRRNATEGVPYNLPAAYRYFMAIDSSTRITFRPFCVGSRPRIATLWRSIRRPGLPFDL